MSHRYVSHRVVKPKVLLVDDEPMLLEGLNLHLRAKYNVSLAYSGPEALEILDREGTFAVVMSDMRMPGMSGAELLQRVRRKSPGTVRLLLTGYTDLAGLESAVNQGGIFRFLTKPCSPDNLHAAVEAAVEQYRTLRAERTLLEETLASSIDVLTEVLALSNPVAFGRARRVKAMIGQAASRLNLPEIWQYEVAAMLCQLGAIAAPANDLFQTRDASMHPVVTQRLLERIPRLESVAAMVGGSASTFDLSEQERALKDTDAVIIGAILLRMCLEVDRRVELASWDTCIHTMQVSAEYATALLDVLSEIGNGPTQSRIRELSLQSMEGAV